MEKENKDNFSLGNLSFSLKRKFLTNEDMATMISIYLDEMFSDEDNQAILRAENSLIINLFDLLTDLELVKEDKTVLVSMNNILENYNVVNQIKDSIVNWSYFNNTILYKAIQNAIRENDYKNSLGFKLDLLISKGIESLNTILESDVSDERLEKLKNLLTDINQSEILKKVAEKV